MQTDRNILGIDTSNYKTSVAITDRNGNIICDFRELLQIKKGDKGLRQSDALFQHIKILPDLIEKAMSCLKFNEIAAVSVSTKPRPLLDSYMPVFKAGESIGRSIAASLGVDLFEFSHQEGHIEAVKYYSRLKNEPNLLCFNLSGVETKSLRNLEMDGLVPEIFEKISDLLIRLSIKAMEETSLHNIVFTGGVAESLFIRNEIIRNVQGNIVFGVRNLSSDNAVGISLLGGKSLWQ